MSDYREYLKRYAEARGISEAEAAQHEIVRIVWRHYHGEDVFKFNVG